MYKIIGSFVLFFVMASAEAQAGDSIVSLHSVAPDSVLEASLRGYYTNGHFDRLLRKYSIRKITCAQCDAVWAEVVFGVDSTGTLMPLKTNRYIFCHRGENEKFIRDLYISLRRVTVPQTYAGKYYVWRFGRALKC